MGWVPHSEAREEGGRIHDGSAIPTAPHRNREACLQPLRILPPPSIHHTRDLSIHDVKAPHGVQIRQCYQFITTGPPPMYEMSPHSTRRPGTHLPHSQPAIHYPAS